MLVLRCTRRLAGMFRVELHTDAAVSTGKLGDWFANITAEPVPLVVCVNAASRLVLVVPANDLDDVVHQFRGRLQNLLEEFGVGDAAVREEVATTTTVTFAPTNDRRVVGSMNDICFHVAHWLESQGSMFRERELIKLERRLARMPHVKLDEPYPDRKVRQLLCGNDRWTG